MINDQTVSPSRVVMLVPTGTHTVPIINKSLLECAVPSALPHGTSTVRTVSEQGSKSTSRNPSEAPSY